MSAALGHDLANVHIHTDALAGTLAQAVQARAFTTGTDVYFGGGEYKPASSEGKRLLAHELTHVVQQRGLPTTGELTVSDPGDALEREADLAEGALAWWRAGGKSVVVGESCVGGGWNGIGEGGGLAAPLARPSALGGATAGQETSCGVVLP